jgi:hypothetical protein
MRDRQGAGGRRQEGYNLIFKPDLVSPVKRVRTAFNITTSRKKMG